jgi:mono/diheme cytochrome c family protein
METRVKLDSTSILLGVVAILLLLVLGTPLLAADTTIDVGEGEQIYSGNCAGCHQANGEGVPGGFPPLAGHAPELVIPEGGREYLINVLLYGLQGEIEVHGETYNGVMPAWAQLEDEQIADVLNHIVTAWDNQELLPEDFEAFDAKEVEEQRGQDLSMLDVHEMRQELDLE